MTDMPHTIRDDRKFFSMLREHLESEGFEWCAGPAHPLGGTLQPEGYVHVNAVFWRRSAWEASAWTTGVGGSVVASLRPRGGPAWNLSVACIESPGGTDLSQQLKDLRDRLPGLDTPALLCGVFNEEPPMLAQALRGEGLRGFRSAHPEVLGKDLPWTTIDPDANGVSGPPLSTTDGIYLGGGNSALSALAVLGGHAEGPRARDNYSSICRQTFPTNHLPLLVVAEHHPPMQPMLSNLLQ